MTRTERTAWISTAAGVVCGAILGWAGSWGGLKVSGMPVFAMVIAVVFGVQWLAFLPSFAFRTERFYDVVGSVTYVGSVLLAAMLAKRGDVRNLLLAGMVLIWALRLGSFLFLRVLRSGKDDRFRDIKQSFARFLAAWTIQALWITFTVGAVLAAMTASRAVPMGALEWIGLVVWLVGFGLEATADEQKRRFRGDPSSRGRFIQTGLWAWSRHPNYFGEIVLWVGAALVAAPVLRGWAWVTMLSPVFVLMLLTRVSGIPILERRADERWGEDAEYRSYRARTSVLIPRPPRRTPRDA